MKLFYTLGIIVDMPRFMERTRMTPGQVIKQYKKLHGEQNSHLENRQRAGVGRSRPGKQLRREETGDSRQMELGVGCGEGCAVTTTDEARPNREVTS